MKTRNKINQIANFIEEFNWFLKSKKNIDLDETALLLRNLSETNFANTKNTTQTKDKKIELVGILPGLFQDKELFQQNKDLVDFAENLFKINITRPKKRTRSELIGMIVIEISNLNKKDLEKVVNALSIISSDINKMKEFKKAKEVAINFSWNNAISKLNK